LQFVALVGALGFTPLDFILPVLLLPTIVPNSAVTEFPILYFLCNRSLWRWLVR
jgi:hypothetical protein